MPRYTISTPSGRRLTISAPDEATALRGAQEWDAQNSQQGGAQQQSAPNIAQAGADMSWGNVGTQAVKNLPRSAVQFGIDMMQPILHPIKTGKNLLDLAEGGLQHAGSALGVRDGTVTPEMQKASGFAQFYKDRYGNTERFKNTLATDPVGALSDISTPLTGGGMAVAKAPGIIGKAGRAVQTAGKAIDPLTPVLKGAGAVAKPLVGMATGVGNDAVQIANRAAKGDPAQRAAFKEGLRGQIPEDQILTQARDALAELRDERHTAYIQNMQATKANQTPINPLPVAEAWVKLKKELTVLGSKGSYWKIDKHHQDLMMKIEDLITQWREDHGLNNAIGLDALKRHIDSYMPANPTPQEKLIITRMRDSVKKVIVAQEPTYAKAMSDYESMSAQISEIERTLSLGHNATTDTATRKLLSSLRNNVNTNFGKRRQLIDLLDAKRPGLKEAIAGVSMSTWTPRGIQGALTGASIPAMGAAIAKGLIDPTMLGGYATSSPRLVGEGILAGGKASPYRPLLSGGLYQTGRAADERRMNRGAR